MAIYLGDQKVQTYIGEVSDNDSNALAETTIIKFKSTTLKAVGQYGLAYQHHLKKIDLWSVESIAKCAFCNDFVLDTLIIRTPKVCALPNLSMYPERGYVFYRTPIEDGTGFIYVPDDLVNKYKSETNWCLYSSQIKPISELRE